MTEKSIINKDISEILKSSYLDYAVSTIKRMLPDVRDGLRTVQRRILFAMRDLPYNGPTKKSAKVVGDVLGKYHPHGDSSVYEALVHLTQPFTTRYPLIIGQGNFGSIDGDPPAAMRYTEVKLSKIANVLFEDIDKQTVNFTPNYDNTLEEPEVLPSRLPLITLLGTGGIAVGFACSIPPFNLGEVCDAVINLIHDPNLSWTKLLQILRGPDFPSRGIVFKDESFFKAIQTGSGSFKIRGRAVVEKRDGRDLIIINEIPYHLLKTKLVDEIVQNTTEGKIHISDIKDESKGDSIRLILTVKRGKDPQNVLNCLYKYTSLETSFLCSFKVVDIDGSIKTLSARDLLLRFIDFRRSVVLRRISHLLKEYNKRKAYIESLLKVSRKSSEVLNEIKQAKTLNELRERLKKLLDESAIEIALNVKLSQLSKFEGERCESELKELENKINTSSEALKCRELIDQIIEEETSELKKTFADERRTEIKEAEERGTITIIEEPVEIYVYRDGYVSRRRTNKTLISALESLPQQKILFFTSDGRLFSLKASQVVETERHLSHLVAYTNKIEPIIFCISQNDNEIILCTARGVSTRLRVESLLRLRQGTQIMTLQKGDRVVSGCVVKKQLAVVTTKNVVLINSSSLRTLSPRCRGVRLITLDENDHVVKILPRENETHIVIAAGSCLKRVKLDELRPLGRGSRGVIISPSSITSAKLVSLVDKIFCITSSNKLVRVDVEKIPEKSRQAQGLKLFDEEVIEIL